MVVESFGKEVATLEMRGEMQDLLHAFSYHSLELVAQSRHRQAAILELRLNALGAMTAHLERMLASTIWKTQTLAGQLNEAMEVLSGVANSRSWRVARLLGASRHVATRKLSG